MAIASDNLAAMNLLSMCILEVFHYLLNQSSKHFLKDLHVIEDLRSVDVVYIATIIQANKYSHIPRHNPS